MGDIGPWKVLELLKLPMFVEQKDDFWCAHSLVRVYQQKSLVSLPLQFLSRRGIILKTIAAILFF